MDGFSEVVNKLNSQHEFATKNHEVNHMHKDIFKIKIRACLFSIPVLILLFVHYLITNKTHNLLAIYFTILGLNIQISKEIGILSSKF